MKDFFEFIQEVTAHKRAANHHKIATNYQSAGRSLARFTAFVGMHSLSLTDIHPRLMERYESYLRQQCDISRNTTSCYMRSLRAIYNEAVRQDLCADTRPFRNVYTGVSPTRKRALPEHLLRRLFRLDLRKHPALGLSRDLFLFSFLAHGIAFIDLAKLQTSNIRSGHLHYCRSKTGTPVRCAIDSNMEAIIRRWHVKGRKRLFPIIGDTYDHRQYESALHRYNRHLHKLSVLCGESIPFSSYSVRHSWASTAYHMEVPMSVISTCMGHATEEITRIYLTSLDSDYIDRHTSIINNAFSFR